MVDVVGSQSSEPPWHAARRIAEQQSGLVTVAHLRGVGLTPRMVQHACRQGRLARESHGVYRFGAPPRRLADRCTWALLVAGTAAIVSHDTAARLHGLLVRDDEVPHDHEPPVHLTVVCGQHRRVDPRLVLHRCQAPRGAVLRVGALPTTDVPWTLRDLAARVAPSVLLDACRRAITDHGCDPQRIRAAAATHRGPGATRLRTAIDTIGSPGLLRSGAGLHADALLLVRRAGLPEPAVEAPVLDFRVDLLWANARLVVEVDGRRGHDGVDRQRADADRDHRLRTAGYAVVRVRSDDLRRRSTWLVETLRHHLRAAGC